MFPTRFPLYTYTAIALSIGFAVCSVFAWFRFAEPLQVFYLTKPGGYVYETTLLPTFGRNKTKRFRVLASGKNLGTPDDSIDSLKATDIITEPAVLHQYLKQQVYGGGLDVAMTWPVRLSEGFALVVIIAGCLLDRKQRRRFREGVKLRGPDLLSVSQFNRQVKGDGFALHVR